MQLLTPAEAKKFKQAYELTVNERVLSAIFVMVVVLLLNFLESVIVGRTETDAVLVVSGILLYLFVALKAIRLYKIWKLPFLDDLVRKKELRSAIIMFVVVMIVIIFLASII